MIHHFMIGYRSEEDKLTLEIKALNEKGKISLAILLISLLSFQKERNWQAINKPDDTILVTVPKT